MYDPPDADVWKKAVRTAWLVSRSKKIEGPVNIALDFFFRRPASHFGTGKNAGIMKESAPRHHTQKCDIDNAAKLILDVLTKCDAWIDDCHVVKMIAAKQWAEGMMESGCQVQIWPA